MNLRIRARSYLVVIRLPSFEDERSIKGYILLIPAVPTPRSALVYTIAETADGLGTSSSACAEVGLELALACDFRIASDKSLFGLPEVNLAIIPGGGGTQRLPRLIGKTKALELLMIGEQINAADAERLMLVNKIVPAEEFDRAVDKFVQKLLTKSPVTLGILKDAVNKGLDMGLEQALNYEAGCFEDVLTTEEAQEGLKAFLEKRKPKF